MTLGGLTLAIGILVDESIIAVENIHRHLGDQKPIARAVLDASREVVVPRLLSAHSKINPAFRRDGLCSSTSVVSCPS